jgi:lipopolysaccharide/colanic/teichoic acid biosynthesis glycosyltransferase
MGTQSSNPGHSHLYTKVSHTSPVIPATLSIMKSDRRLWADSRAKRIFDVIVASLGIVVLLPLFAVIALLVKLTSSGPVFFLQTRVGKGQMPFTVYKYRTMYDEPESETSGPLVTRCGDHRFTSIGIWLRRFKLDELPQLFNVIQGDMSLIGPRPKLPEHERMRMICKPGITGAATVIFAQEQSLLKEIPQESFEYFTVYVLNEIKAKIDKEYAETGTFKSDLRIILATVGGFCRRKPATSIAELLAVYGHESVPISKALSPGVEWIN